MVTKRNSLPLMSVFFGQIVDVKAIDRKTSLKLD